MSRSRSRTSETLTSELTQPTSQVQGGLLGRDDRYHVRGAEHLIQHGPNEVHTIRADLDEHEPYSVSRSLASSNRSRR